MKAITVIEWVDALRSGNYKQTVAALHADNGFCCLGLAEEIAGVPWDVSEVDEGRTIFMDPDGCTSFPGWGIKESMGEVGAFISHEYPSDYNFVNYREKVLAEMNDSNWTFEEIADSIMGMYLG